MTTTAVVPAVKAVNPYPGLRPFEAEESHLFFGREKQIAALRQRLVETRFLSVVGGSGSGKSSLVRAGLLPALQASSSWRIAILRPGADPIANLAGALYSSAQLGHASDKGDLDLDLVRTALHSSAVGLSDVVKHSRLPASEKVIVVVDQFEEIFRYRNPDNNTYSDLAHEFVKLLLTAASDSSVPVYIVITMRSDFIGSCSGYPGLPQAVSDGQFLVPWMTRSELRLAITGPASFVHTDLEPSLVVRLLNDAGDDPDQLPVLQHALMRTWDYWNRNHKEGELIGLRHYEAIGGMQRALSKHAEEAYSELTSPEQQTIAERAFRALVETDDRGRLTRRPTTLETIAAITAQDPAVVNAVIQHFSQPSRGFIVLRSDSFLDLSHESLFRIWTRLSAWAAKEAEAAEFYRRLSKSAALHKTNQESLWVDPQLTIALNWLNQTKPTEAWAERYAPHLSDSLQFLEQSRRAVRRHRSLRIGAIAAIVVLLLGIFAVYDVVKTLANIKLQQANAELEKDKKSLDGQVKSLQQQQAAAIVDVATLRQKNATLTSDISNLTSEAAAFEPKLIALKKQNDDLLDQQEDAIAERDFAFGELNRAVSKNARTARLIQQLVAEAKEQAASLSAMNAENRGLMTRIAELGIKLPPIPKTPPAVVPVPSTALPGMQASGAAAPPQLQPQPDEYRRQLIRKNASLRAQAEQLNKANQSLSAEASVLRTQNEKLTALAADLRRRIVELAGELKLLKSIANLRMERIADIQATAKSLSNLHSSLNAQRETLEDIDIAIHDLKDDLRGQIQQMTNINAFLKQVIQDAQSKK